MLDQGDLGPAETVATESLSVRRAIKDRHAVAESLAALAFVAWRQPNETRARTLFAESLVIGRAIGDQAGIAECERGLTALASADGVA